MLFESQLKPKFKDWNGYHQWLQEWKVIIHHLNDICKRRKREIKQLNKQEKWSELKAAREKYKYDRVMVTKMLTLRTEAVARWNHMKSIKNDMREHYAKFPIELKDARVIDFHFNKKHLEFSFIPMWVLKIKGNTYYLNSITSKIGFSTKERPDHPSTKGMIRFTKADVFIDGEGHAEIS